MATHGRRSSARRRGGLGKIAGDLLLGSLCLFGSAESAWAQNVVVEDAAGGTVATGADFTIVKDSLNGNTAYVTGDLTESAMVGFSGDTSFSIISEDGTLKKISAGTGMTAGSGAFFNLSTGNMLTLDLSNVQFSGGKGVMVANDRITGGAIFSAGSLTLTGNAIFGGTGEGEGNTAGYGGALGAYGSDPTTRNIELNGTFQFINNSASWGGAIDAGTVTLSGGTNTFIRNSASWGGAIHAITTMTLSGGTNTFIRNSASWGGAIHAGTVTLSGGMNTFTGNSADGNGGAIHAIDVTLSGGMNTFTGNTAGSSNGGAIEAGTVTFSGGTNTFIRNSATHHGGAIYADNVTFSGAGSVATFSGNTASGVNNDIDADKVTIQDGGTYSFGGGIVAGSLIIGVDGQDGTPEVTFGSGSITKLSSFTLTGGSRLNVMLNQDNLEEVGDASKMTKFEGGGATGSADSVVWFFLDATENGTYTAMLGDNKKFESSFFAQMTQDGSGVAVVKKGLYEITIDVDTPTGIVHRYNSASEHQISDDLFNVAATGAATGDKIILTGDAISTAVTNLSGVTSLSIYSNVAGTVRKITNTNATDGNCAFLSAAGDLTLNLSDVQFAGGRGANDGDGGAIYSAGKLTLKGNAIFGGTGEGEGNTASYGGALAAFGSDPNTRNIELNGDFQFINNSANWGGAIYALEKVTLSGTSEFSNNSASDEGGAIYSYTVMLSGTNTFSRNKATSGGAIWTGDMTLSGTNTFTGNLTSDNGGAISANNAVTLSGGTNTFTNNSATYLGGAISASNAVTFSGGTNTFTNNSANRGGAIYAWKKVTFSGGTNTFTGNSAGNTGGAIFADDVTFSGGTNTFTGNSAGSIGGAIRAYSDVTFSGAGSVAMFTGNKADGVNNDIYSVLGAVTIRDGGTYYFGGGIVAANTTNGKLTIGVDGQDGTPDVTFGSGSITNVRALELAGGNLSVWLNSGNEVDAIGDIADTTAGATKFTSANAVTVSGTNSLKFYLDGILSVNDVYN
ncbi:MAG: hypothetical protein Q4D38_10105, partial [Planctomycetia bacterium]|nr:hypothetical protein [Planctomycetia bacterium]